MFERLGWMHLHVGALLSFMDDAVKVACARRGTHQLSKGQKLDREGEPLSQPLVSEKFLTKALPHTESQPDASIALAYPRASDAFPIGLRHSIPRRITNTNALIVMCRPKSTMLCTPTPTMPTIVPNKTAR